MQELQQLHVVVTLGIRSDDAMPDKEVSHHQAHRWPQAHSFFDLRRNLCHGRGAAGVVPQTTCCRTVLVCDCGVVLSCAIAA